jgi:hypothetical protein
VPIAVMLTVSWVMDRNVSGVCAVGSHNVIGFRVILADFVLNSIKKKKNILKILPFKFFIKLGICRCTLFNGLQMPILIKF